MKVGDIVKAVRWCIDEEAVNAAEIADVSAFDFGESVTDLGLMNNIIKHKIPTALRWVCLYAPAEMLSGVSSSSSVSENEGESESDEDTPTSIDIIVEETTKRVETDTDLLKPKKTLVRVIRVKGSKWNRAILGDSLIKEDSDEYLAVHDSNGAQATNDRPQAALVNTKSKGVEVFPSKDNTFSLTYVTALSESDLGDLDDDETPVGIPSAVETSFIYYLAYLLCVAYGDARAKSMFDVATLNLGRSEDKQRQ